MEIVEIKRNEEQNNGKLVHLYFNKEVGFYTAYGLSAFLVTFVVNPVCSYSESMEMPVALLTRGAVNSCRQYLKKLQHQEHVYYLFEMDNKLPKDENYEKWVNKLKKHWT